MTLLLEIGFMVFGARGMGKSVLGSLFGTKRPPVAYGFVKPFGTLGIR